MKKTITEADIRRMVIKEAEEQESEIKLQQPEIPKPDGNVIAQEIQTHIEKILSDGIDLGNILDEFSDEIVQSIQSILTTHHIKTEIDPDLVSDLLNDIKISVHCDATGIADWLTEIGDNTETEAEEKEMKVDTKKPDEEGEDQEEIKEEQFSPSQKFTNSVLENYGYGLNEALTLYSGFQTHDEILKEFCDQNKIAIKKLDKKYLYTKLRKFN